MRDVFTQKRCRFQGIGKKSLIKGSRTQGLRETRCGWFQGWSTGQDKRRGAWARAAALANIAKGQERPRTAVGAPPSHRRGAPAVSPQFTALSNIPRHQPPHGGPVTSAPGRPRPAAGTASKWAGALPLLGSGLPKPGPKGLKIGSA